MKRYIQEPRKANSVNDTQVPDSTDEQLGTDFDVQAQLEKLNVVLEREVRNLMGESSRGKLNAGSSRDLVAYIKLLSELKIEELKRLSELSDEEVAEFAK